MHHGSGCMAVVYGWGSVACMHHGWGSVACMHHGSGCMVGGRLLACIMVQAVWLWCMVEGQLLGCIMMVQAVGGVYLVQAVWLGVSCLDASWFSCMVGGQFFWFCMKRK